MIVDSGFEAGNRFPPVSSPIWEARTKPLFEYLSSPRSIDEIIEWAAVRERTHEWANNMLAWLSLAGKARYDDLSRCWMLGSNRESVLESWGGRRLERMEG